MSTDFQLSPTDTEPPPYDTGIPQPAAVPTYTPAAPAPAPQQPDLNHTPGGLPAIPLVLIGSNTAVAGLSAAAIIGGPIALAAVGAAAITGVAVAGASRARARSKGRKSAAARRTTTNAGGRTGSGTTGGTSGGRRSTSGGTSTGARKTPKSGGGSGAGRRSSGLGSTGTRTSTGGGAPKGKTRTGTGSGTSTGKGGAKKTGGTTGGSKGRVGQVKDLRAAKKNAAPTKKDQRQQTTAARRALRDNQRAAKTAAKNNLKKHAKKDAKKNLKALQKTADKTGPNAKNLNTPQTKKQKNINKVRTAADKTKATRGERIKQGRRDMKARAHMSRRILGSGIRYAGRAGLAALIAAPAGILGCITTPIGRHLGWNWLQQPGRRLYRRLTGKAKFQHLLRVQNAKNTHTTEATAAEEGSPIAETVPRGPRRRTSPTTGEIMADLKFLFEESAADMEEAARAYEPGGMVHVYQTIQGMPAGIQSWANTFKILAEKSDESFPLDPAVGEELEEVFALLQKASTKAEEVQETFERKHEHDLERLSAPRKSLEAEKTWDIGNNEEWI